MKIERCNKYIARNYKDRRHVLREQKNIISSLFISGYIDVPKMAGKRLCCADYFV